MEVVVVHLGLGSNLGNKESNLRKGIDLLEEKVRISQVSPMYETEPWGFAEQPSFLNCVCRGETTLSPWELLAFAKDVEAALKRQPTFRNGPRTLDVDILFYGDAVISEAELEIPHPRLASRGFVLVPLADISPELRHPVLGVTAAEMLRDLKNGLNDETGVRL